jgi:serine/threonine protein kinase
MGTVYLAEAEHGKQVAIKVINPDLANDPHFGDRFRREVAAARKVRPFCTAPVLDAGLDGHPLYVVTEYIAGPTLEEAITDSGPLHASDLTALAVGVATALAAIHDAGIVHRDLKPSNVLLSGVGPRVIDFGIAKAATRDNLTRAGQYLGTPAYQAPEHIHGGPTTPATDVFSWACVVAFAATGRDPFSGAIRDTPRLDGLDHDLRHLVTRALSEDPAARPTVAEILDRLTGRTSQPHASAPASPPHFGAAVTPGKPRQRAGKLFPILISAAVGAILVVVPVTAAFLDKDSGQANTGAVSPSPGPATVPPTSSAASGPPTSAAESTPALPNPLPTSSPRVRWRGTLNVNGIDAKEDLDAAPPQISTRKGEPDVRGDWLRTELVAIPPARIAPLPPGDSPEPTACRTAAMTAGPSRTPALDTGDAVCVVTSLGRVAILTTKHASQTTTDPKLTFSVTIWEFSP